MVLNGSKVTPSIAKSLLGTLSSLRFDVCLSIYLSYLLHLHAIPSQFFVSLREISTEEDDSLLSLQPQHILPLFSSAFGEPDVDTDELRVTYHSLQ